MMAETPLFPAVLVENFRASERNHENHKKKSEISGRVLRTHTHTPISYALLAHLKETTKITKNSGIFSGRGLCIHSQTPETFAHTHTYIRTAHCVSVITVLDTDPHTHKHTYMRTHIHTHTHTHTRHTP